jgi:hypothetical protein
MSEARGSAEHFSTGLTVIASAAKQSSSRRARWLLDCFVAALLAMTLFAVQTDRNLR